MFQRAAAAPLSMRSSVQHHARPFAAQQQQQQTTPASAGVDFDDAKKTPRRLGLVFGVGYYRSGERHGERSENRPRCAISPQLYIFFVILGRRYTIRFRLFAFFDDRSRETRGRPPSSSILPKDHLHPHPRARARFRAKEKRKEKKKKKKKKKTTVWRRGDSIRFESFFSFDDGGRGDVSLPIEFVSFFPTTRENASSAFLFFSFSFEEGGGGGRFFYYFYFLVFFTTKVFAVTHQSRIYVCSFLITNNAACTQRKCKCK